MQEHDKNHIFQVPQYYREFLSNICRTNSSFTSFDHNLTNRLDITAQRVR